MMSSIQYPSVITRFLRSEERLIASEDNAMPLVIEAKKETDPQFLQKFLTEHSKKILEDIAQYGAVLLRGFDISSEGDYEKTILSIRGFHGISEAFMSEEGRVPVGDLKYVLHTNAVYKTGGTLYLGGFHSENYYSADVPSYICFFCQQPSQLGGETGLISMQKIYKKLNPDLKARLEKSNFFVTQWLVSEVAKRYQISNEQVKKIASQYHLPIVGEGADELMRLYKPNIFIHPVTQEKCLQINLFEVIGLNEAMRTCFLPDYPGKTWFWHRFIWKSPRLFLKIIEKIYISIASFCYSPKDAINIYLTKRHVARASKKIGGLNNAPLTKVGSCFNDKDIQELAQLIRQYYVSCLWKKGDILLVDNRQVMHAGMPGAGPRLIRALIGNPIQMQYAYAKQGVIEITERNSGTVGAAMRDESLHVYPNSNEAIS